MKVSLDSVVMTGEKPAMLQYSRVLPGTLKVWKYNISTYERTPYTEGVDYSADYEKGTVSRLNGSAIADFADSPFYGQDPFDHDKVASYGNDVYTVYMSYETLETVSIADIAAEISRKNGNKGALCDYLSKFTGDELTFTVFGDSISTGCEAYPDSKAYYGLFASDIKEKYGIKVRLTNMSVGGDNTPAAAARFERDVMSLKSDIICIAFGMNDQNKFGDIVPVSADMYGEYICGFIDRLQSEQKCKIILLSPPEPHERWIHTSGKMPLYVAKLREIAAEKGCAFADANSLWKEARKRKESDALLHNGINHPNNYGHQLLGKMLETLI